MKKNLLASIILTGLVVLPLGALAQTPATGCTIDQDLGRFTGVNCPPTFPASCPFDSATYDCAMCCTLNTIVKVTNWIFIIIIAISGIMVILGGYEIVTSAGDQEKYTKGRDYIKWAIVGLIVALVANAIPGLATSLLGI